ASEVKARFELKAVAGYYEAIDYLRGHDQYANREVFPKPNLILLDYALGSFKGTDFLRWVRKEHELATLPVVVLRGSGEESCVAECYAVGANYFIAKPTFFLDLVKIVRCLGG